MAESFPYPISLSVGKNIANYKEFVAAVAADTQKEYTDLEKRTAEAEKNIKKLLKLTDIEMKIGDNPTSISIDKNEANNKNSAVASKIFDADPIIVQEFTDLKIKIAEAEERLIEIGKSLEEQNSRFGLLQCPAYLSNTSLIRSVLTSSNASKSLADLEIKIKEAEKNTEKVLIELNKRRNERNRRSNASLTRSHTLAMVTASLDMVTVFGFGLVAGILVALLPNKRR